MAEDSGYKNASKQLYICKHLVMFYMSNKLRNVFKKKKKKRVLSSKQTKEKLE